MRCACATQDWGAVSAVIALPVAVATATAWISSSISELGTLTANGRAEDRNASAAQMNALIVQIAKDRAEDRNAAAAQTEAILEDVRNMRP